MTPKEYLEVVKAVSSSIESNLLDTTGAWKHQPDLPDDAKVIADSEAAYIANGGVISSQISTIINALVSVLPLLGGLIK